MTLTEARCFSPQSCVRDSSSSPLFVAELVTVLKEIHQGRGLVCTGTHPWNDRMTLSH